MPIGALRALRRLGKFSNGNAIVISGDKVTARAHIKLVSPSFFPFLTLTSLCNYAK